MSADTQTCVVRVLGLVPVRGSGRLVAMAGVVVEIAGVELLLRGVQVVRGPHGLECRPPQFRDADGQWAASIVLPPELQEAIGNAVLDQVHDP
jgi:hypothetical protein